MLNLIRSTFLTWQDYDDEDLNTLKNAILTDWDADKDGKIYIDELKMMFRVQRQMSEKWSLTPDGYFLLIILSKYCFILNNISPSYNLFVRFFWRMYLSV